MSAPETDIERCARAARDAYLLNPGDAGYVAGQLWERIVAAVLSALREPSEGMCCAPDKEGITVNGEIIGPRRAWTIFTAMIDAALGEKG